MIPDQPLVTIPGLNQTDCQNIILALDQLRKVCALEAVEPIMALIRKVAGARPLEIGDTRPVEVQDPATSPPFPALKSAPSARPNGAA